MGEHTDLADNQVQAQTGGAFTPAKVTTEPDKFTGVTVKQFPKGADNGEIMEFLISAGLPENLTESVVIRSNGVVTIKGLENLVCKKLIEFIHSKQHFNRKLFCNGIIPLTPAKEETEPPAPSSQGSPVTPPNIQISDSAVSALTATPTYSPPSELVRRHSLSLRTPPPGSIAQDILSSVPSLQ